MRCVIDLQGAQTGSRYRGIGRYSISHAKAMITASRSHEPLLLLNNFFPEHFEKLRYTFRDLLPADRVVVFDAPAPVAEIDWKNDWRRQTAERVRESFITRLEPDVIHVTSFFEGFWDNAVTSSNALQKPATTAVTVYDLIPSASKEKVAPADVWYLRKMQELKSADLLLAISEASRREAIEVLQVAESQVVTISTGVDPQFRPMTLSSAERQQLLHRYGIKRPFVMYSGAGDHRKNLGGLIHAFALLPLRVRRAHQLVIVGKTENGDKERLLQLADKAGLQAHEVLLKGYVPDDDLVALYNSCALFVLPSFSEGFGLPLVEAMACGVPAIGSDRSGIQEVIGRKDAMFDPSAPKSIAERMHEALTDEGLRASLREYGLWRAQQFTWEVVAQKTWDALEAGYELNLQRRRSISAGGVPTQRPRMALISPLPPLACKAANYSEILLRALSPFYEIDLIVNQGEISDPWIASSFLVRDTSYLEAHSSEYDRILYVFGSSREHVHMPELLRNHPGTVLLLDFFMSGLWNSAEPQAVMKDALVRNLYVSHGYAAISGSSEHMGVAVQPDYPANRGVLDSAAGVIVASPSFLKLADDWYGSAFSADWILIEGSAPGAIGAEPDRTEGTAPFGDQYALAIEHFANSHPLYREKHLVESVASVSALASPSETDLAAAAFVIAQQRPARAPHQLLLDLSETARLDAKTGIQRVARNIATELIQEPPHGYRGELVMGQNGVETYARKFAMEMLGRDPVLPDEPVEVTANCVYVALDLYPKIQTQNRFFQRLRQHNVPIHFVVHDLLPLTHPAAFPRGTPDTFREWLNFVLEYADGLVCTSKTGADELVRWLDNNQPARLRPLDISFFHLGSDLKVAAAPLSMPYDVQVAFDAMGARSTILMVGTIEPRKRHLQALAAAEELWAAKQQVNLVIVGKEGWIPRAQATRIRRHREINNRLFWLEDVSDNLLVKLYRGATVLLAASEAEGFGLPLVEAASQGIPLMARDIPIFREVAGQNAFYFHGDTPHALASALFAWLELNASGGAPSSAGVERLTWKQSAQQLVEAAGSNRVYRTWKRR